MEYCVTTLTKSFPRAFGKKSSLSSKRPETAHDLYWSDAWKETETEEIDNGCCRTCTFQNRERTTAFFGLTYHDYFAHANFAAPDLAVAFNTGMYEQFTDSWKASLEVVWYMSVPALFTSYNKDEAVQDHAVLTSNANVLADAPILNPMREDHAIIEACGQVDAFFQRNMCCTGFKGRA